MWLVMDLKYKHHKDISLEEIGLHVQKHVNYSKLNSQPMWPLNKTWDSSLW